MNRIGQHNDHVECHLWAPMLVLLAMGLLMLTSSSMSIAHYQYGKPFYYLLHQVTYLAMGSVLAVAAYLTPIELWLRWRGPLIVMAWLLLLAVYVPGLGSTINGARRWLKLGFMHWEVCETVKFAFVVYLAGYIGTHRARFYERWDGFLVLVCLMVMFMVPLLFQPDFGTVMVLAGMLFFMLVLAGFPWRRLFLLGSLGGGVLGLIAIAAPYRLARMVTFLHPWADQFNKGYQLTQSLMAVGRGGLWGVGLGNGMQKLFYLPEAHTDFLYAVLCEELGLIGGAVVIIAYVVWIMNIMRLGRGYERLGDNYRAFLAYGAGLWFSMQSIVNVGVNMGVLPTKGLTLPLMSYGGSHTLMTLTMVGVLLRLHRDYVHTDDLRGPLQRFKKRQVSSKKRRKRAV